MSNKFIDINIRGYDQNNNLEIIEFTYNAKMNSPFRIKLKCEYRGKSEIQTESLFGRPVSLTIADENHKRYFHEVILSCTQSNQTGATDGLAVKDVRFIIGPPLALMEHHRNSRVFQAGTIIDYIKTIADDYKISISNPGDTTKLIRREFCIQYNESDLNFVNRLCESEGVFYYFQNNENESKIQLGTGVSDYFQNDPVFHFGKGGDKIHYSNLDIDRKILKKQVLVNDYDHIIPNKFLKSKKTSKSKNVNQLSAVSNYIFPHPVRSFNDDSKRDYSVAEQFAEIHNDAEQSNYESLKLDLENVWWDMDLCYKFMLENKNSKFVITKYKLQLFKDESNSIRSRSLINAIDFIPFRPLAVSPVPNIPIQTATVVGTEKGDINNKKENNADKNIYVKVKFHWDNDPDHKDDSNNCSCWIRTSQIAAGKDRGFIFIPRIGDEVSVAFECGHPDMPIIAGSSYNGKNSVPYSLSDNRNVSGIVSRTVGKESDVSRSSAILLKDDKNAEELSILTIGNQVNVVGKDSLRQVDGSVTEHIKKNVNSTVDGDIKSKVKGKFVIEADEICLKVGGNFIQIKPDKLVLVGTKAFGNSGDVAPDDKPEDLPNQKTIV